MPHDNAMVSGSALRVLVADEDPAHSAHVRSMLPQERYEVERVETSDRLRERLSAGLVDVAVVDYSFADDKGLELFAAYAPDPRPGLIVYANGLTLEQRVKAAACGADQLLDKPLNKDAFCLFLNNLVERLMAAPQPDQWVLDSLRWQLRAPGGRITGLTYRELMVLMTVCEVPGQAVAREYIMLAMGQDPENYDPRRLEILIRRLRNKALESGGVELPLTTVHGVGYAFTAPVQLLNRSLDQLATDDLGRWAAPQAPG